MIRTPIHQDKRFLLAAGSIVGVLALSALGKPPNEQVLTYMGAVILGFLGQSQWGQTKRTAIATGRPPDAPPPA